jgi:glycosyltransferase involved in cell wall biosynthesis
VLQTAHTRLEARSYGPNVRRDGEIFRAARLIVSTSRWAAQSIREDYPECTTEVAVMPNPVEVFPRSSAWAEERYRRAVGTPGYRPRVLFVGGEFPRKGGYDLLCAWREGGLSQRADLDLMTGWPLEPDVVPAGVRQHPNVVAHTEAWYALWHAADIFVLPTLDDAFGLAFQEAAASAVPAIGTRLNAVPEIIQEGSTGLLIAPGDRGALVRALDELIASPERRRDMGTRARAFITVSADPDAYRMKLAAAIRHVAGR